MDLQFGFYKDGRRNARINRICGFELIEFLQRGCGAAPLFVGWPQTA